MPDLGSQGVDVEGAIIDADLLVKYRLVKRALETLQEAIKSAPRNIALREKLREIFIDTNAQSDAAQQCMDLAALYVASDKLELANERLLEAKRLDPRVSVTARLVNLESGGSKSSAPAPGVHAAQPRAAQSGSSKSITGDLADINIFDIVQILENSRMTGTLTLSALTLAGNIYFNEGLVVDAVIGQEVGNAAFAELIDLNEGQFEFEKSPTEFRKRIDVGSNTSLILDVLREKDEARNEADGTEGEGEFAMGDG
jgi:tetratricopeptide (TPR) repeat protein